MNEFEWLRQMRELNQPVAPRNDLWARIDAALEETAPTDVPVATPIKRARHRFIWAMAASVAAVVVLAGGLVWHTQHAIPAEAPSVAQNAGGDNTPWKPSDPRLAGAAVQLDAARMELQQAMQQAPDSPALQRLLQRTDAQQALLRDLEKHAG